MALAINVFDGCGPSKEIHCQLQLRKIIPGKIVITVNITAKGNFTRLFGSDFILAVWQFFVSPPNFNHANKVS